jgi:hypothetical protein
MARRLRKFATESCPLARLGRADQITGRLEKHQAAGVSHHRILVGASVSFDRYLS